MFRQEFALINQWTLVLTSSMGLRKITLRVDNSDEFPLTFAATAEIALIVLCVAMKVVVCLVLGLALAVSLGISSVATVTWSVLTASC